MTSSLASHEDVTFFGTTIGKARNMYLSTDESSTFILQDFIPNKEVFLEDEHPLTEVDDFIDLAINFKTGECEAIDGTVGNFFLIFSVQAT